MRFKQLLLILNCAQWLQEITESTHFNPIVPKHTHSCRPNILMKAVSTDGKSQEKMNQAEVNVHIRNWVHD